MRKHPAHRLYTALVVLGGMLTFLGIAIALLGVFVGLAYAVFGGLVLALGLFGRRAGAGAVLVNASLAKLSQGQLEESEKLLDEVERSRAPSYILRPLLLQRTMIALRRGDTKAALAAADRAVALPLGVMGRAAAEIHQVHAIALRAVVKASEGDADGARRDAAQVLESASSGPQALARAVLAQAMVLERSGERAELRDHLERHRRLLEMGTEPRERAIVRAMQRMLRAPASTVYRVAPARAHRDPRAEPTISEWLEKIAPNLAAFGPGERGPGEPSRAADERYAGSGKAPVRAPTARRRRRWDVALISAGGIGAILYLVLAEAGGGREIGPEPARPVALDLLFVMMVLVVGILGYRVVAARRDGKKLLAAMAALARGEDERAEESFTRLSDGGIDLVAAQADLALSTIAEMKGDLALALEHCERGLGRLSHYGSRIAAADLLAPELGAQRAFLLTAMDRHEEASQEIAALPEGFAFRPRAVFRVEVLRRVRVEGMASAADYIGGGVVDRILSARDELLSDVVRATARPELAGPGEIARLRDELRSPSRSRVWLGQVAPKLLEAFDHLDDDYEAPEREPHRAREDEREARGARGEDDHEAEREAEAEAEADLPGATGATVRRAT